MILWNKLWNPICAHDFWDNQYGAEKFCQKLGYNTGELSKIKKMYPVDKLIVGTCNKDDSWPICTEKNNLRELGTSLENDRVKTRCDKSNDDAIKIRCTGEIENVKNPSCQGILTLNIELKVTFEVKTCY